MRFTSIFIPEASVHYETQCNSLNIVPATADGSQVWQATDLKDNSAIFDTVIVTIPVPQLLRLEGSIQCAVDSKRALLEDVQYSSRYALALYFALGTNIDVPWTAKYIQGDSCVRFICVDSKKRAKGELSLSQSNFTCAANGFLILKSLRQASREAGRQAGKQAGRETRREADRDRQGGRQGGKVFCTVVETPIL